METGQNLLIRADADPQMGTGHVMRCLALAQAWQENAGSVEFLMAATAPAITERLRAERMQVRTATAAAGSAADTAATIIRARELGAAWVVMDGYQFHAAYQSALKQAGLKVLWVDDYGHAGRYCADLVLNQNLYAAEALYAQREAGVRLLLGARYALLRREFLRWREWQRSTPEQASKVLITMGGADAAGASTHFVEALQQLAWPGLEVTVVAGPANPRAHELEDLCRRAGKAFHVVSAGNDMPELMSWSDAAAAAAGSTSVELLFMGLPAVMVVQSENQQRVADTLNARGLALNLGGAREVSAAQAAESLRKLLGSRELRLQMSERGRKLVDGLGPARVLDAMGVPVLLLRRASDADCEVIWKWASDPEVRAVSFSPEPIPWESHVSWFHARLADPFCLFYIASNAEGEPVGQARYDVSGQEAVISVSLARRFRGRGHGARLLRQASSKVLNEAGVKLVHAYVKPGNEASVHAFLRAGYRQAQPATVRGHQALHFILEKETTA
ncbi:MAG TPA: UDP-2,4-diacetamido-2,4,6-trideoxy-beta-L-altropyranose hydrolase [Terriglobales bacterium]|jgi:UDP-2,4-diacetamido-2,4,6-trideoxy-beta-L-altropyranose hydrolase|nr:UDP-2,4-diacetamido-2,4,6-trideoxy-beta-L-altropyranose hydrolase [Terriglobales bacterium]